MFGCHPDEASPSPRRSFNVGFDVGNHPRERYPLLGGKGVLAEGGEGVQTPPQLSGRGGREVAVAAVPLCTS